MTIITHMEEVISEDLVRGPSSQVRLVNLGPKAVPFRPDRHFDYGNYNDNEMIKENSSLKGIGMDCSQAGADYGYDGGDNDSKLNFTT